MATPNAPTNLIENLHFQDRFLNRPVRFTTNPSYLITEHEYSLDAGSTFADCTSNLITVPAGFYNLDDIQIRVKAIGGDTASTTLNNIMCYLEPQLTKPAGALDVALFLAQGQSNMVSNTNRTNPYSTNAKAWEGSVKEFVASDIDLQSSMCAKLGQTYFDITGTTCVFTQTAVGGSTLQDIGGNPSGSWNSNKSVGTLRYDSIKEFFNCVKFMYESSLYNVVEIKSLWNQGEADVNGDGSYPAQNISLAEYNNNAIGVESMTTITVGYREDGTRETELDEVREWQYDAIAGSNLISLGFDRARDFVELKMMNDNDHWERQGQDKAGYETAYIMNGLAIPSPIDVITTEFMTTEDIVVYSQNDDGVDNRVIGGTTPTLEGGATTSSSATPFGYGQGVNLDGSAGYVNYLPNPRISDSCTVLGRFDITDTPSSALHSLWGDISGSSNLGIALASFTGTLALWVNGQRIFTSINASSVLINKGWKDIAVKLWFDDLVPSASFYVDGVLLETGTCAAGAVSDWNPVLTSFSVGCAVNGVSDFAVPAIPCDFDDFRIYNSCLSDADILNFTTSSLDYDQANTPVTPTAPELTNEDTVYNTITLTPVAGLEVQLKDETNWTPTNSPYAVTYETYDSFNLGDIRFRVAAEGINPESAETANTQTFKFSNLIIEDGSIVPNANSFTTVEEQRAFAAARGVTLPAENSDVEILSFQAMDYLEAQRELYQGSKTEPLVQALQWPRIGVKIDCTDFPSDAIPKELKNAQMQLIIELNAGVVLMPTTTGAFITEDTVGPITTKYSEKVGTTQQPNIPAVDNLLAPLFNACGSGFALRTVRL